MDRREAIRKAIEIARNTLNSASSLELAELGTRNENVVVLITGKGTDPYIMRASGEKESWNDKEVVREELRARK